MNDSPAIVPAVLLLLLAACSYIRPDADLIIHPTSLSQVLRLRESIDAFAQEYGLERAENPYGLVRPGERVQRHVGYGWPGAGQSGFDFNLYEYSDRCWVIKLAERNRRWSELSRTAFWKLTARLREVLGPGVRIARHPDDPPTVGRGIDDYCPADEPLGH